MSDLTAVIAGMPKSKLHVDIDGTLEPETRFHLARRNRLKLPYKHIKARKAAIEKARLEYSPSTPSLAYLQLPTRRLTPDHWPLPGRVS
jgi:adenosine deaminase